jgi:hypothetical protein
MPWFTVQRPWRNVLPSTLHVQEKHAGLENLEHSRTLLLAQPSRTMSVFEPPFKAHGTIRLAPHHFAYRERQGLNGFYRWQ